MFDSTEEESISNKLWIIDNIKRDFDSFKIYLLEILESLISKYDPLSPKPRFILSDIQNEENKEQISEELGKN